MNYEDQNTQEDYAAEFRSDVVQFENKSTDVALFGVDDNGKEHRVEIPIELRSHQWVDALVRCVNNTQFNEYAVRNSRIAFEYFMKIFADRPDLDVRFIGLVLLEYLKKGGHGENAIFKINQSAHALFTELADYTDNFEMKVIIRDAAGKGGKGNYGWGNWPKVQKPDDTPRDSLACEFGTALGATNEAFLNAFVEFNQAFVIEWYSIRNQLRTAHTELHARLVAFVEGVGIERLNWLQSFSNICSVRQNKYNKFTADDLRDYEELVSLNSEILLTLDNAYLNCLAFGAVAKQKHVHTWAQRNSCTKFDKQTFKRYFLSDTGIWKSYFSIKVEGKNRKTNSTLPYNLLDFLQVSQEEKMCVSWLLAMYRAPLSGIEKLELDDTGTDNKDYYVDVFKSREAKTENPNFAINSPQGRTLKTYLKSLDEQALPVTGDELVGKIDKKKWGLISTPNFKFWNYFTVNADSSSFNKVTKNDVGFTTMTDEAFNLVRDTFLQILDKPTNDRPSLVVTKFSQALIYAEQAKRGDFQKSDSMSEFTYDEEDPILADIAARKNFHSLNTQDTVYRVRSRDKMVLKMGQDLGLSVNAEMGNIIDEILKKKLDPATGETRILTHEEYRSAIGMLDVDLEASPEALRLAAQAQNFIVEESGLIEKDGKVLVIDDAMTAFLMSEKMKHIEEAAGDGFANLIGNFGRSQIIAILSEYLLIEGLYERLSETSRHAAKKPPYSKLVGQFKFAPIIAGGVL